MLKTRCDGHWECKDCDIVWFVKIVGKIGTEELECCIDIMNTIKSILKLILLIYMVKQ
jgi:hypothetical protein